MEINIKNPSSSSKTEKKIAERNRRNEMKSLYSNLNSLLPHQSSAKEVALSDQIDEAAKYIKKLQINLEKIREKKDRLMENGDYHDQEPNTSLIRSLKPPQIEIYEMGSALEIVLITRSDCQLMFSEIIRLIHEQGAEIVHASFSAVDDAVFHTIHSTIGESSSDDAAARISARLRKFDHDAC